MSYTLGSPVSFLKDVNLNTYGNLLNVEIVIPSRNNIRVVPPRQIVSALILATGGCADYILEIFILFIISIPREFNAVHCLKEWEKK